MTSDDLLSFFFFPFFFGRLILCSGLREAHLGRFFFFQPKCVLSSDGRAKHSRPSITPKICQLIDLVQLVYDPGKRQNNFAARKRYTKGLQYHSKVISHYSTWKDNHLSYMKTQFGSPRQHSIYKFYNQLLLQRERTAKRSYEMEASLQMLGRPREVALPPASSPKLMSRNPFIWHCSPISKRDNCAHTEASIELLLSPLTILTWVWKHYLHRGPDEWRGLPFIEFKCWVINITPITSIRQPTSVLKNRAPGCLVCTKP